MPTVKRSRVPSRLRVVIVQSQGLLRDCLSAYLSRSADIDVVGAATTGQALAVISHRVPDVVVSGTSSSGAPPFAVIRQIAALQSRPRVVVLAPFHSWTEIARAFEAGATACVSTESDAADVLGALYAAQKGKLYMCLSATDPLLRPDTSASREDKTSPSSIRLTEREREIIRLIGNGNTDGRIAGLLNLSDKTVHTHRMNIMTKLGVHKCATLLRRALQLGLVQL